MANKQKTFESTNLPALVNKIVKVRYTVYYSRRRFLSINRQSIELAVIALALFYMANAAFSFVRNYELRTVHRHLF